MLGLGSSGSAWLAADRLTGGHLVIKKVQSSPRSDKYREIDILCKLKHVSEQSSPLTKQDLIIGRLTSSKS